MAFRAGRLKDHDLDGIAGLELGCSFDAEGEHFVLRDDGLGLGPDIDDEAIGRSAHDHPLDDLATAEVSWLGILKFEECPHVHLDFGGCGFGGGRLGGIW